jgi:hypothetical protein
MQKPTWIRRFVLAGVWAFAASTWSSIGHHLFGLPDAGLLLVLAVAGVILLWPTPSMLLGRHAVGDSVHAS